MYDVYATYIVAVYIVCLLVMVDEKYFKETTLHSLYYSFFLYVFKKVGQVMSWNCLENLSDTP